MALICRFIRSLALIALITSAYNQTGAQYKSRRAPRRQRASYSRLLFSIPVGGNGIHYKGDGLKEVETWGPASLRIAPDGTFLITDTVTNRILLFDHQGRMLPPLKLKRAEAITDAVKGQSDIYALDGTAPDPTVIHVQRSGQEVERFSVQQASRSGLSGISLGEGGEALLELYGGATVLGIGNQPMRPLSAGGRNFSVSISRQSAGGQGQSEGSIQVDGRTVATVRVRNTLGGLNVLATTPEGDFYVLVEELTSAPNIVIDQTVRHYRADGHLLGFARVPIAERFTYVSHGVAVGPDRQVYALITRPQRADVIQLEFEPSLSDILPSCSLMNLGPAAMSSTLACRRTRDEIRATATVYINNTTFLTSAELTGPCTYRQEPTYLGTNAGTYISVPYDWGGFDSVVSYNNFMRMTNSNYRAGDRKEANEPSNYTASCSRGVDCSGFVSRCWGLTSKESTSSLSNISVVITASELHSGDILNRAGKHVVIFDKLASDPNGGLGQGLYTWEATQTNKFDRVVYHWWPWSRFRSYIPRRYKYVCS